MKHAKPMTLDKMDDDFLANFTTIYDERRLTIKLDVNSIIDEVYTVILHWELF